MLCRPVLFWNPARNSPLAAEHTHRRTHVEPAALESEQTAALPVQEREAL